MREAGRLNRQTLEAVKAAIAPGVTTGELNEVAESFQRQHGVYSPFKDYDPGNGVPQIPVCGHYGGHDVLLGLVYAEKAIPERSSGHNVANSMHPGPGRFDPHLLGLAPHKTDCAVFGCGHDRGPRCDTFPDHLGMRKPEPVSRAAGRYGP